MYIRSQSTNATTIPTLPDYALISATIAAHSLPTNTSAWHVIDAYQINDFRCWTYRRDDAPPHDTLILAFAGPNFSDTITGLGLFQTSFDAVRAYALSQVAKYSTHPFVVTGLGSGGSLVELVGSELQLQGPSFFSPGAEGALFSQRFALETNQVLVPSAKIQRWHEGVPPIPPLAFTEYFSFLPVNTSLIESVQQRFVPMPQVMGQITAPDSIALAFNNISGSFNITNTTYGTVLVGNSSVILHLPDDAVFNVDLKPGAFLEIPNVLASGNFSVDTTLFMGVVHYNLEPDNALSIYAHNNPLGAIPTLVGEDVEWTIIEEGVSFRFPRESLHGHTELVSYEPTTPIVVEEADDRVVSLTSSHVLTVPGLSDPDRTHVFNASTQLPPFRESTPFVEIPASEAMAVDYGNTVLIASFDPITLMLEVKQYSGSSAPAVIYSQSESSFQDTTLRFYLLDGVPALFFVTSVIAGITIPTVHFITFPNLTPTAYAYSGSSASDTDFDAQPVPFPTGAKFLVIFNNSPTPITTNPNAWLIDQEGSVVILAVSIPGLFPTVQGLGFDGEDATVHYSTGIQNQVWQYDASGALVSNIQVMPDDVAPRDASTFFPFGHNRFIVFYINTSGEHAYAIRERITGATLFSATLPHSIPIDQLHGIASDRLAEPIFVIPAENGDSNPAINFMQSFNLNPFAFAPHSLLEFNLELSIPQFPDLFIPSMTPSLTSSSTLTSTTTRTSSRTVTPSRTVTSTQTIAQTTTPTSTITHSVTQTHTQTATKSMTVTQTRTTTQTPSISTTHTQTVTQTTSLTPTPSLTPSSSKTFSPTPSMTRTVTQTETSTRTTTASTTITKTVTHTQTPSISTTHTQTVTKTTSLTPTPSPTPSPSKTPSPTPSMTRTVTQTETSTRTATASTTITKTVTHTQTPSISTTHTQTVTKTTSLTPTPSSTPSSSKTFSLTPSMTRTVTQTETSTRTATASTTITKTVTHTQTPSISTTHTQTVTKTTSLTPTPSPTPSSSNTASLTPSITQTVSQTTTSSQTATGTLTMTQTVTTTTSPTATVSHTHILIESPSASLSISISPSGEISASMTPTPSPSKLEGGGSSFPILPVIGSVAGVISALALWKLGPATYRRFFGHRRRQARRVRIGDGLELGDVLGVGGGLPGDPGGQGGQGCQPVMNMILPPPTRTQTLTTRARLETLRGQIEDLIAGVEAQYAEDAEAFMEQVHEMQTELDEILARTPVLRLMAQDTEAPAVTQLLTTELEVIVAELDRRDSLAGGRERSRLPVPPLRITPEDPRIAQLERRVRDVEEEQLTQRTARGMQEIPAFHELDFAELERADLQNQLAQMQAVVNELRNQPGVDVSPLEEQIRRLQEQMDASDSGESEGDLIEDELEDPNRALQLLLVEIDNLETFIRRNRGLPEAIGDNAGLIEEALNTLRMNVMQVLNTDEVDLDETIEELYHQYREQLTNLNLRVQALVQTQEAGEEREKRLETLRAQNTQRQRLDEQARALQMQGNNLAALRQTMQALARQFQAIVVPPLDPVDLANLVVTILEDRENDDEEDESAVLQRLWALEQQLEREINNARFSQVQGRHGALVAFQARLLEFRARLPELDIDTVANIGAITEFEHEYAGILGDSAGEARLQTARHRRSQGEGHEERPMEPPVRQDVDRRQEAIEEHIRRHGRGEQSDSQSPTPSPNSTPVPRPSKTVIPRPLPSSSIVPSPSLIPSPEAAPSHQVGGGSPPPSSYERRFANHKFIRLQRQGYYNQEDLNRILREATAPYQQQLTPMTVVGNIPLAIVLHKMFKNTYCSVRGLWTLPLFNPQNCWLGEFIRTGFFWQHSQFIRYLLPAERLSCFDLINKLTELANQITDHHYRCYPAPARGQNTKLASRINVIQSRFKTCAESTWWSLKHLNHQQIANLLVDLHAFEVELVKLCMPVFKRMLDNFKQSIPLYHDDTSYWKSCGKVIKMQMTALQRDLCCVQSDEIHLITMQEIYDKLHLHQRQVRDAIAASRRPAPAVTSFSASVLGLFSIFSSEKIFQHPPCHAKHARKQRSSFARV